jgi:hypothetical protein
VLRELDISRPLLISTERWRELELPVPRRFHGVRPHAEVAGVRAALEAIRDADGLVALGPAGLAIAAPSSPTSNGGGVAAATIDDRLNRCCAWCSPLLLSRSV